MVDLSHNAEIALRMVREEPQIVYDTETSGLDWRIHAPVGYVVGAPTGHVPRRDGARDASGGSYGMYPPVAHTVYVPVRHGGGGNLLGGKPLEAPDGEWQVHEFEKELARAFEYRNQNNIGITIGHHLKFDAHMSANAGVMLGRELRDTQNLGPILNEYQRSFSLANSCEAYGVTAKKGDELYAHLSSLFGGPNSFKSMEHYWRLAGTDPLGYDYAVGDGISTFELYHAMMREIERQDLGLVTELENALIWTLFRMERKGIRVDTDQIQELTDATEQLINEAIKSLRPGFNVRSPIMMKEMMEEKGHTDWPLTPKGAPSFPEKWLKTNEVGRIIIDIRQKENLLNSFIRPLVERHLHNGRVHATLNQLKNDNFGTISGRFSCSDPNLQQVPKRNKDLAKPFRKLFIPDEGKIFWERDWSQCEPRLFAHYAQDKNLLAGYNAKPFRDAHQVVADLLDVERDPTAKRMNMGIFTGMQIRTFAGHMNWPVSQAGEAWHKWFREFPAVKQFQNNAKARLRQRGYVFTVLKRRCRLENAQYAYRGTSKIIQGSNADIAKWKLLEMDLACEAAGDIVEVLMTVHDSFNGQLEDTPEAHQLLSELEYIMEDVQGEPFNLTVPFVAEGFNGPNWSIASFGEEKK